MPLPPAVAYTLTDAEAASLQTIGMRHQARLARGAPILLWGSLAVPLALAGALWLADLVWFAGAMPGWAYLGFMGAFVAGMACMAAGCWAVLLLTRRRMRAATRQYFQPREVRLTDQGVKQSLPGAQSLNMWEGISRAQEASGMILVWAGNLPVAAVPLRAFTSPGEAAAFLAECNARAKDTSLPAQAPRK